MITYQELIDRWNTDQGKPFKGNLINMDAYEKDPTNPGCMCAQGQVLHDLGGWTASQLFQAEQRSADEATAKLLNISIAHAVLLRQVNDNQDGAPAIVLTDPGKVLGDQWHKVLDFWAHLDTTSVGAAAARAAAGEAARAATWEAVWGAGGAGGAGGAVWATAEIQGAEILRRDGKPFSFLPLFGFASPDDIPPRPANYGVPSSAGGE